ncbi:hypothetical protein GGR56DRAFT_671688 [Xylariaceae sp. FL0804]|nr:hypothetical protein GGR56DRAFT_671688 [Xylariaceae sp. FL0804]
MTRDLAREKARLVEAAEGFLDAAKRFDGGKAERTALMKLADNLRYFSEDAYGTMMRQWDTVSDGFSRNLTYRRLRPGSADKLPHHSDASLTAALDILTSSSILQQRAMRVICAQGIAEEPEPDVYRAQREVEAEPARPFVVDVGGGTGLRAAGPSSGRRRRACFGAAMILQDRPESRWSTLLRPPAPSPSARPPWRTTSSQPQPVRNAHVYLLRWILHDFADDAMCVDIVRHMARAMGRGDARGRSAPSSTRPGWKLVKIWPAAAAGAQAVVEARLKSGG